MSGTLAMRWIFLTEALFFVRKDEAITEVTGEVRGKYFWTMLDLIILSIC